MTAFAAEMRVKVGKSMSSCIVAVAIGFADCVFCLSASVLDGVNEVMCEKERDCSENGGFVNRSNNRFQFSYRQSAVVL